MRIGLDVELHRHTGQGDRVAQRDEVAGLFGGLDTGNAGDAKHIALFGSARLNQRQRGGQHGYASLGDRHAVGAGLGCHVDHVGLALGVEMGQGR